MNIMMFYVYYLKSINYSNKFYVGYTKDLRNRLERHNNKLVLSTKPYAPWRIVFYECFNNSKDALRREKYLKTTIGRRMLKNILRDSLA
jgi:putative endonuclease